MVAGWDPNSYPRAPLNGMAVSPLLPGIVDIRWDNPAQLYGNSAYHVVGINIYRSEGSDRGPFHRINEFPLSSGFYRDRTDLVRIDRELIDWNSGWIHKGDKPNDQKFTLKTQKPIVKMDIHAPFQNPTYANQPTDVTVWIDNQVVPVHEVFGRGGEITLVNQANFDILTEEKEEAILPTETSVVEVSYWSARNFVPSGLDIFPWYRLTTVVIDSNTASGLNETPFGQSKPVSTAEIESLDYIWKEAVRRNQWIVQQGGERVKLFIRKTCGIPCSCSRDLRSLEWHKQPENNCLNCYGTGFLGGYDGPFDILIAPDDAERRITQTMMGRRKEHTYEVWMGPSPLVTQRDFLVKQTNERYSVGAVRRPSNRGNLLQQHFSIGYLDEGDVRYRIPIDGTAEMFSNPETRNAFIHMPRTPVDGGDTYEGWEDPAGAYPEGPFETTPMVTEKEPNAPVPDDRERRGRTRVWENIEY